MESAIPRISDSLMLQPNVFQLFQPIGGVRATLFSRACAEGVMNVTATPPSRTSPAVSAVAMYRHQIGGFIVLLRRSVATSHVGEPVAGSHVGQPCRVGAVGSAGAGPGRRDGGA